MAQNVEIVPGKLGARQAAIGIVVVCLMMVGGLVIAAVVMMEVPGSEPGLAIAMGVFWLVWMLVCICLIVSFRRLIKDARVSGADGLVGLRVDPMVPSAGAPDSADSEARLRRLDLLRRDGLVSEEEFSSKRAEILRQL